LKRLIINITVVIFVVVVIIIIIVTTAVIKWLDYRLDILEFKSQQGQGTFLFSQNVQTGSRAYPDSYLWDTRCTFPRDKVTTA
jgi:hypothetical protein